MHWPLVTGIGAIVIGFFLVAELAIHKHYQRSMDASVKRFERKWKELDRDYENKI